MKTTEFDEVGVVVGKDSYGKYYSKFVFLKEGKPVEWLVRTENRALAYALKDCRDALDEISLKVNRGTFKFTAKAEKRRKTDD
jgi:hypothetical protein